VFRLPCGASTLPDGAEGSANILSDWLFRGTKDKSSRELINSLDFLGLHRGSSVSSSHLQLSGTLAANNLIEALKLFGEVILTPRFDPEQFQLSRQLALQSLIGLDDDPRQKVMIALKEQFYPDPLGRSALGSQQSLQGLDEDMVAEIYRSRLDWSKTIFAAAGNYDFDEVVETLESMFGSAAVKNGQDISISSETGYNKHIEHQGAQVHIGLMAAAPSIGSDGYYESQAAAAVLGGSMSSRLFTEVREKRGLCYAVGARYQTLKDHAGIACYAGTTPEKAQETLEVIMQQFRSLEKGIKQEELDRGKVGLKSSVIMAHESTSSRADSAAADHYLLGKVRSLEEIKQKLEEINIESVEKSLKDNPFDKFTIVTIGPKKVEIPQ
jgi:predicted Zn-dependent peptidase